jgi:hypothetical protein
LLRASGGEERESENKMQTSEVSAYFKHSRTEGNWNPQEEEREDHPDVKNRDKKEREERTEEAEMRNLKIKLNEIFLVLSFHTMFWNQFSLGARIVLKDSVRYC